MKKKVLFTATVVKTHIMEFHIPYLKLFRQLGWETAVAARNDYENPADCVIPFCDAYYEIPFARMPWKIQNLQAYRELKRLLEQEHYDLIHCHTPVGAMVTRLAARKARKQGTRVVYTAHGFHFYKGAPLLNWLLFYPPEWLLAHITDVLVTINREDYAFARKHLHAGRVEYVPGVGLDTDRFCPQGADPMEKRRELGLDPEDFVLLTVAELTRNKNHTVVLKAIALLKDPVHYLICGGGAEQENLLQEARELGIEHQVHFLGYRRDVPELCRCSDLFLFLSRREGLPVALMEAMGCGLPAVCSRIRGNTDLVEDGVSGVFADSNPQAVAGAISGLRENSELRHRLGRGAREAVMAFDSGKLLEKMKEIYLSTAETAGEEEI